MSFEIRCYTIYREKNKIEYEVWKRETHTIIKIEKQLYENKNNKKRKKNTKRNYSKIVSKSYKV